MAKATVTDEGKKALSDILIIVIATFAAMAFFIPFQEPIYQFARDQGQPVLLRTLAMALIQFGVAGLGISLVMLIRRERFSQYGLIKRGALTSIGLSVLAFVPNIVFEFATGRADGYFPFQSVWMTREILTAPFPAPLAGLGLIAVAWGFFEGFNYVVICRKINCRFPSRNRWLNWGALTCAVMCILIHGMIGLTPEGILEALTVMVIIYGMLMASEFTGNAWGCVFVFVFLWNAF